jgi:hypothetical protein
MDAEVQLQSETHHKRLVFFRRNPLVVYSPPFGGWPIKINRRHGSDKRSSIKKRKFPISMLMSSSSEWRQHATTSKDHLLLDSCCLNQYYDLRKLEEKQAAAIRTMPQFIFYEK